MAISLQRCWGDHIVEPDSVCLELVEAGTSVAGVELTGGDHRVEVRLCVSGTGRSWCTLYTVDQLFYH